MSEGERGAGTEGERGRPLHGPRRRARQSRERGPGRASPAGRPGPDGPGGPLFINSSSYVHPVECRRAGPGGRGRRGPTAARRVSQSSCRVVVYPSRLSESSIRVVYPSRGPGNLVAVVGEDPEGGVRLRKVPQPQPLHRPPAGPPRRASGRRPARDSSRR